MTIDGCKVILRSASCFRAFGGGYGIKMRIEGDKEFIIGTVPTRGAADLAVAELNRIDGGLRVHSEEFLSKYQKEAMRQRVVSDLRYHLSGLGSVNAEGAGAEARESIGNAKRELARAMEMLSGKES